MSLSGKGAMFSFHTYVRHSMQPFNEQRISIAHTGVTGRMVECP